MDAIEDLLARIPRLVGLLQQQIDIFRDLLGRPEGGLDALVLRWTPLSRAAAVLIDWFGFMVVDAGVGRPARRQRRLSL
jgi:hypothetical protein